MEPNQQFFNKILSFHYAQKANSCTTTLDFWTDFGHILEAQAFIEGVYTSFASGGGVRMGDEGGCTFCGGGYTIHPVVEVVIQFL